MNLAQLAYKPWCREVYKQNLMLMVLGCKRESDTQGWETNLIAASLSRDSLKMHVPFSLIINPAEKQSESVSEKPDFRKQLDHIKSGGDSFSSLSLLFWINKIWTGWWGSPGAGEANLNPYWTFFSLQERFVSSRALGKNTASGYTFFQTLCNLSRVSPGSFH